MLVFKVTVKSRSKMLFMIGLISFLLVNDIDGIHLCAVINISKTVGQVKTAMLTVIWLQGI